MDTQQLERVERFLSAWMFAGLGGFVVGFADVGGFLGSTLLPMETWESCWLLLLGGLQHLPGAFLLAVFLSLPSLSPPQVTWSAMVLGMGLALLLTILCSNLEQSGFGVLDMLGILGALFLSGQIVVRPPGIRGRVGTILFITFVMAGQIASRPALWMLQGAPAPDALNLLLVTAEGSGVVESLSRRDESNHSIQLTGVWSIAPGSVPTHIGLFSGRGPWDGDSDWALRLSESESLAASLRASGSYNAAFVSHSKLSVKWGFAQGFDVFEDAFEPIKGMRSLLLFRWLRIAKLWQPTAQRDPEMTSRLALSFVEKQSATSTPYFAWVHLADETPGVVRSAVQMLLLGVEEMRDPRLVILLVEMAGEVAEDELELSNTALRMHVSIQAPGRSVDSSGALLEVTDLIPTVMEWMGLSAPRTMTGRSFATHILEHRQGRPFVRSVGEIGERIHGSVWDGTQRVTMDDLEQLQFPKTPEAAIQKDLRQRAFELTRQFAP